MIELVTVDGTLRADARRNRERIVAAAAEAFAERGLEVGVAEIARRAGVGNATVFRRFPTKEDLIVAVIEDRLLEVLEGIRAAQAADDPGEALAGVLHHICEIHCADRGLIESTAEHFAAEPRLVALRDEVLGAVAAVLVRAQEAGAARRDLEPVDLVVLANAIAFGAQAAVPDRPDLYRRYLAIALAGLRPEPGAPPLEPPAPTIEDLERAKRAGRRC